MKENYLGFIKGKPGRTAAKISLLLILFYIFFSQNRLLSSSGIVLVSFFALACIVPGLYFITHLKGAKNLHFLLFALFTIILFFGALPSPNLLSSMLCVCYCIGALLIFYYLCSSEELGKACFFGAVICAAIHLFAVLFHRAFPALMEPVARLYFDDSAFAIWKRLSDLGYSAGLLRQVGFTALFVSPVAAFSYAQIINSKKHTIPAAILLCLAAAGIIITIKRAAFGALIFAMVIATIVSAFDKKTNRTRAVLLSLAFIGVFFFILMGTGLGKPLEAKFDVYDVIGGSGRDVLWGTAITDWKLSPLFGSGTNFFSITNVMSTHNTYLQLLAENGIVGVGIFIVLVSLIALSGLKKFLALQADDDRRVWVYAALFFQAYYLSYAFFESAFTNSDMFILYVVAAAYPLAVSTTKNRGINHAE